MKVYFEITGGSYQEGKLKTASIQAYVTPTKDGHGYFFDTQGKKHQFAWCDVKRSKVYDQRELPADLWYSIRHGVHRFDADVESKDDWTFDDLIYTKVKREQVEAGRKVCKLLPTIQTIDDFKKAYPTFKKYGYITYGIVDALFRVTGIPHCPAYNGEIGMAFMNDILMYQSALRKLGIEVGIKLI